MHWYSQLQRDRLTEIDAGSVLSAMTFFANGEYLAGSSEDWRVEDGKGMTTLEANNVESLAG